jgi:Family of unknown function (DUF5995)
MSITIGDVIERMRAIQASLDPRDGISQFNRVYLLVTEAVRDHLADGFFHDRRFVERFDVVFAERYFAAVDADAAEQPVDPAWRAVFERRGDTRVLPVQFVVAGMNTHINHDLALAMVATCLDLDTRPGAGYIADDYRRVNQVIEKVESKARRSLLSDLEREIGEPIEPLIHLLSTWSITQAREAAWIRMLVFWLLQDDPWLLRASVGENARTVGMTSRHLLTPLLAADQLATWDARRGG